MEKKQKLSFWLKLFSVFKIHTFISPQVAVVALGWIVELILSGQNIALNGVILIDNNMIGLHCKTHALKIVQELRMMLVATDANN